MKVILYMAMTANGMIARENDEAPSSKVVWREYYKFIKQNKNIIVGRRTYELMKNANEFEKLGNPITVVISSRMSGNGGNTFFVMNPEEALKKLEKKGFKIAVIGGGSKLNASFLKSGLIDEICLDVEPCIFGKGIRLFSEIDAEANLTLVKTKKLSKNTVRLIYEVIKNGKKTK